MRFGKMSLREPTALASLSLPVAAVLIWPRSWWTLIVFVLWTAAVFAGLAVWQRRAHREHCDKLLAHAQLTTIRTLSHHRHDWMNELQIIYGYLKLGKLDKAVDVVDRIRAKMEQDSRISQLGCPELASYLLSFRTICDTMRLEVEIEDSLTLDGPPLEAEKLSQAIIGAINVFRFRASASHIEENVLTLYLARREGTLNVVMRYSGELAAADSISAELEQCLQGAGRLAQELEPAENSPQERTMIIHFPLPA